MNFSIVKALFKDIIWEFSIIDESLFAAFEKMFTAYESIWNHYIKRDEQYGKDCLNAIKVSLSLTLVIFSID